MGVEGKPSHQDLVTDSRQDPFLGKQMSRRDFLKLAAASTAAVALTSCSIEPREKISTVRVENEQNPELSRLLNGLNSVFEKIPTTGIPDRFRVVGSIESKIYIDDSILRANLQERLSELPPNETGRDLIIQSLGYPHIIHNNSLLLGQGFDVYNNFNPTENGDRSDFRVLEVLKHDINEIEVSKKRLKEGRTKMKGYVINYDEHSSDYLSSDAVDVTFPDTHLLKELGITRLIFVGEFSPQVEERIASQIADDTYAPRDHIIDYIQTCQNSGIDLIVWGIDTRHDINNGSSGIGLPEQRCDIEYVELASGPTVIFGGCSPGSNPRVKLQDETLMRIVGGVVQVMPPDNPLGRNATPEETNLYYQLVNEARSQN